jgi:hypothetical protein
VRPERQLEIKGRKLTRWQKELQRGNTHRAVKPKDNTTTAPRSAENYEKSSDETAELAIKRAKTVNKSKADETENRGEEALFLEISTHLDMPNCDDPK